MSEQANSVDRAVDLLTERLERDTLCAPVFADPAADAVSIACSAVGREVTTPDAQVERDLDPVRAVLASSGIYSWRVSLRRGWVRRTIDPLIAAIPGGFRTLLPAQGIEVDTPGRRSRRLHRDGPGSATALIPDIPIDHRWRSLLRWSLRRRSGDTALLLLLSLLMGLAGLALPVATNAIFESAIPDGSRVRIAIILGAYALISIAAAILVLGRGLLIVRLLDSASTRLSPAVSARLLSLRPEFFRDRSNGEVANRALSVEKARQQVDGTAIGVLLSSVFGLVNLGFLLAKNVTVGIATTVAVIAVLSVSLRLHVWANSLLPALLEARSTSDATLLSVLRSLVSWRVAGAEGRALARWAVDQRSSTRAMKARLRVISTIGPVEAAGPTLVLAAFTVIVVIAPGSSLAPGNSTAPGLFLAMYAAVAQLSISVIAATDQLITLSELAPTLGRMEPILTAVPERPRDAVRCGRLTGAIGVSGVAFGYREGRAPLFNELTLDVAAGEFVAIVGPSGSGKSTLLRLLLGFEYPSRGMITYDGQDLAGLDVTHVRRQLGVVLQSSQLLGATIRECVRVQRQLTDRRIWELLEQVAMADDVERMPAGLDAEVGDHGSMLSGGQRQRLTIAAALAGDPRILFFDEATSALDNRTQSVVMRTVLSHASTRIVVAHRMSTIRHADRIVVVSGGRIVEQGEPDELLRAGGQFSKLAARQEA